MTDFLERLHSNSAEDVGGTPPGLDEAPWYSRLDPIEVLQAIANDEQLGFCIRCGSDRDCCEPDAREYKCEECGAHAVYGAEEILLMGLVQ